MSLRRAVALAFTVAMLAGCGSSSVPSTASASGAYPGSVLQSLSLRNPDSTPTIKKVSPIQAEQSQHIVIKGKGFGKMKPYDGDSPYIQILVTNPACDYSIGDTWQAGYESSNPNLVTLNVAKWANKKIVISGFTGDYGQGPNDCWVLLSGQSITINVWNAQTGAGPATWSGKIK